MGLCSNSRRLAQRQHRREARPTAMDGTQQRFRKAQSLVSRESTPRTVTAADRRARKRDKVPDRTRVSRHFDEKKKAPDVSCSAPTDGWTDSAVESTNQRTGSGDRHRRQELRGEQNHAARDELQFDRQAESAEKATPPHAEETWPIAGEGRQQCYGGDDRTAGRRNATKKRYKYGRRRTSRIGSG
ncbi:hypothetical protein MTO96_004249 [Rhipicephalus appendiculatus]